MTTEATNSNSFRTGAGYIWRGLGLIRKPQIRTFVVVPLLNQYRVVFSWRHVFCLGD